MIRGLSFAEHLGQVLFLSVGVELVKALAITIVDCVFLVDESIGLFELLVDLVIYTSKVSLLKIFNVLAMPEKQWRMHVHFAILKMAVVLFVLLVILHHKPTVITKCNFQKALYLPGCPAELEHAWSH